MEITEQRDSSHELQGLRQSSQARQQRRAETKKKSKSFFPSCENSPGAEERSINGVLGGYAVLHAPDVADSTAFLQGPPGERPQDFGTIDDSIISAE